jgi:tetratricopeptide (TPR) repeat protein
LALIAYWLASDVLNGWNKAGSTEVDAAEIAARKAISLDPTVARAHHALGWVHRIRGDHKAALANFKEAIKVDPNFAAAYAQAANEMVFLGDSKDAIKYAEKAIELSPHDMSKDVFTWVQGRAYFAVGDYGKAADALGTSVHARKNLWFSHAWLVSALALCNRNTEAQQALNEFKSMYPDRANLAAITKYYNETQYQSSTVQKVVAELLKGLKKAGMK